MPKLTNAFPAMVAVLALFSFVAKAQQADPDAPVLRFATYNAALARDAEGALLTDLRDGEDTQIRRVAEIIQRVRPDVLLINEFDYDPEAAELFRDAYLGRVLLAANDILAQPPASPPADPAVGVTDNNTIAGAVTPLRYDHIFIAPSNTGMPSGADLDGDGIVSGAGDAQGYGAFPGQYGMLVLSRYPIDLGSVRTFQTFLWKDMPDAQLPENSDGTPFYGEDAEKTLRLSSKSHWDVPIQVGEKIIHFLVSHPTPPVFDGPEDRNGRRNADEIRFWADYIDGAGYIYDDTGRSGGLDPGAAFVIAGDLNADPFDGDSHDRAVRQLIEHPGINASDSDPRLVPSAQGGVAAGAKQGGINLDHVGNPAFDTADFGFRGVGKPDGPPGNLRVDYVLPSMTGLDYVGGGIFWPAPDDPLAAVAGLPTSDHRLVWIDVALK